MQKTRSTHKWVRIFFTLLLGLSLCMFFVRSLQFIYRTTQELQLPLYKSPRITAAICEIDPESISIDHYHRFWYDMLGMNCKDRCE